MSTPFVYAYRAARHDGSLERGVVEAESTELARASLSARGLFPMEVRLRPTSASGRRSLPACDLALGLRALATLLESGLPISRALAALADLVPPSWNESIATMSAAVREGKSLAAALGLAPVAIPPVVIGIVQAGEGGSGLPVAVRRAAELTEQRAATQSALRSALAYPLLLAVSGAGSMAVLVGVVLPRFGAILADLGQALPPTTRLVLDAASVARTSALPMFALLIALVVVWRAWVGTPAGSRRWSELLLGAPIVGRVRHAAATARACAALSALLESGVPLSSAIVPAARATGDDALEARLLVARAAITTGQRIAHALAAERAMTPTAIRLVRAGEESGQLAAMLSHAARLEADQAERTLKNAVRLLEPALILAFGGMVALTAAALLQAVYSVRPT